MFLDAYQSKSFYEAQETNNINSCSNNLSPLIYIFYMSFNHKFKLYSICGTNVFYGEVHSFGIYTRLYRKNPEV